MTLSSKKKLAKFSTTPQQQFLFESKLQVTNSHNIYFLSVLKNLGHSDVGKTSARYANIKAKVGNSKYAQENSFVITETVQFLFCIQKTFRKLTSKEPLDVHIVVIVWDHLIVVVLLNGGSDVLKPACDIAILESQIMMSFWCLVCKVCRNDVDCSLYAPDLQLKKEASIIYTWMTKNVKLQFANG